MKPDDKKVQKAFEKALKTYGHRPDVTGVDIGYKYNDGERTDEITVRIHVREKIPLSLLQAAEVLPTEIDGVPIDVIQGNYAPSANGTLATAVRRARRDPIQPGISISHHMGSAGTIGAVVFDRTDGQACILSNKHVLAEAVLAEPGDQILQPGRTDGGRRDIDAIARLRRTYLGRKGDAAIAALNDARVAHTTQFGSGADIRRTRRAMVGDRVTKSGRTTGVTEGMVEGVGRFKINYPAGEQHIDGFKVRLENAANPENREITFRGDSGSLWYDANTQEGLGLHFAGEDDTAPAAEYALACHLDAVLDELLVSLEPVAPEDFIAPGEAPPAPANDPAPSGGPTLADLLSGLGANEEALDGLSHADACAAALREYGLQVIGEPGGPIEIVIDPETSRGKVRITFEPK